MTSFNVITLFPELIDKHLSYLPFKRALEKDLITVNLIDLRDFAVDDYGSVDDKPYGGGVGMVLRIEPIYKALEELKYVSEGALRPNRSPKSKIILLTPKGLVFSQEKAEKYSQLEDLTIICGRYEGVDARVEELVDETISLGNFILSGGELAALAIMESTTRLIPGVLEKEEAVRSESFSIGSSRKLEFPQYTRPEDFYGLKVPKILLSGDHKKIAKWRDERSRE